MNVYHKIQTVYKRNPDDNYKTLMEGEWSVPEFELLKDIIWMWSEKIDGTNIRIMPEDDVVRFGGKTNAAQIPTHLLAKLQDVFPVDLLKEVFPEPEGVCLYGEGYGVKIQSGGNYICDDVGFILFDVKVGKWWLTRDSVEEIAEKLSIPDVPVIGVGTLEDAIEYCRCGFKSVIAKNKDYDAEGLVMKPVVDLFNRAGNRIVAKIKHKDF